MNIEKRMPPDDLAELVGRAQQGDLEALGALFDAFYDGVYRFAYLRLGNIADAEEAAQETFTQMVRSIRKYREGRSSFEGWLFTIARNVVVDEHRRRGRARTELMADLPEQTEAAASAEDEAVARASLSELAFVLGSLPSEQRCIVELRFGAGLSAEQIGTVLGKSAGAVRIQQMRALQSLRAKLEAVR